MGNIEITVTIAVLAYLEFFVKIQPQGVAWILLNFFFANFSLVLLVKEVCNSLGSINFSSIVTPKKQK